MAVIPAIAELDFKALAYQSGDRKIEMLPLKAVCACCIGVAAGMSSTKNKRSSSEAQLDRLFRALGDQTRRALLTRLARGPAMITELAEPFGMSFPAVSRHIRVLERAKLVHRTVEGRVHRCSLRAEPLTEAQRWLADYQEFWKATLESLAIHVRDLERKRAH